MINLRMAGLALSVVSGVLLLAASVKELKK